MANGDDNFSISDLVSQSEEREAVADALFNEKLIEATTAGGAVGSAPPLSDAIIQAFATGLPTLIAGLAGGTEDAGAAAGIGRESLEQFQALDIESQKLEREKSKLEAQKALQDVEQEQRRQERLEDRVLEREEQEVDREFRRDLKEMERATRLAVQRASNVAAMDRLEKNHENVIALRREQLQLDKELVEERVNQQLRLAAGEAVLGKGKKDVPAGESAKLADLATAEGAVQKLTKRHKNLTDQKTLWVLPLSNPVTRSASRAASAASGGIISTSEAQYERYRKQAAQLIGVALEKGKLSNDDYVKKYVPFIPSASAREVDAQLQLDDLRALIKATKDNRIKSFERSGLDVSGFMKRRRLERAEPAIRELQKRARGGDDRARKILQQRGISIDG